MCITDRKIYIDWAAAAVIAGKAPPHFVIALRALMDFRYLAQSRQLNDTQLAQITSSLQLFHTHKQSILDARARVGKGNKPMTHFQIPKLELMHSVVPSVTASGVPMQWTADTTECHELAFFTFFSPYFFLTFTRTILQT